MRREPLLLFALLLTLMGCGGPRTPLTVGVKEINTDVLIGPQGPTPRATLPPLGPPTFGFPGFVQPPTFPGPPSPPEPPPPSCPTAEPFAAVEHPTTTVAHAPPAARAYQYRDSGTFRSGNERGVFPRLSSRTIENVEREAEGGGYAFDVTIPGPPGVRTTTTYHVYPTQPDALSPPAGIYIEQVTTKQGTTTVGTFQPVPSLLLMPFPASISSEWDARGVDPTRQILMQYHGAISARGVVDACGTRLEGWVVSITGGLIRSATADLTFSATLWIAPQYGGISIRDTVDRTGTENGEQIEIVNTSRISREPVLVG